MFSNDNNVETIAQLVEVLKQYIGLRAEYLKLDVIEKVVRLLTVIAIVVTFTTVLLISLIYLSFSAVYALQPLVESLTIAFLIVGGAYLFLLIVFILLRHQLIERPLVRFLAGILMSK
ncbi:hypothetical protein HMPREF9140_00734 [Prevotella micans F0438]|jgi:hypothetical protein|uniref:Phage holin family protein n=1 Tax=Prevotella micans F0438 TaxID=883158 RepID=H1Q1E6_9BACT|nr:phage holin family protein [Prevotella micans]EHO72327.1 hypothetical protein HMPREF9140_00734 [Prevotella micans F0438]